MLVYEIVLDGELDTDVPDALHELERRDGGGATILVVPTADPAALPRALTLLENLGIGVTAFRQVSGNDHVGP